MIDFNHWKDFFEEIDADIFSDWESIRPANWAGGTKVIFPVFGLLIIADQ